MLKNNLIEQLLVEWFMLRTGNNALQHVDLWRESRNHGVCLCTVELQQARRLKWIEEVFVVIALVDELICERCGDIVPRKAALIFFFFLKMDLMYHLKIDCESALSDIY